MENRIKDLILFGLGSALMTREKIESLVDEFARHGKMSREEARSFVDETIAKGKSEGEQLETRLRQIIKDVVHELDLVTREDLEKLREELTRKE
ncbi:hypothetical protein LGV61_06885 [Desulfurispirillum indicum]|uniref:phasin family protein n=1 Tax=Desulfurispirillum indicum TaxID=936456 RepID=UPI001CFB78AA|nr:hypothetical protein [Desulfurispirillum indicum]UCZ55461.1 hypothetical protein LGV61_06885 [Desulfurispirillum indicum]